MMEVAGSSEMLVHFYQTTQCHIPEDSCLQNKQNVSSCIISLSYTKNFS
jgi:hypothetical protein